jgi:hypothetical protein
VVVEVDEEMEREDERGVAKRPDLNELDVPEWAELALDKVEWMENGGSKLYCSASPAGDGDSEPQAGRSNWGLGFDCERGPALPPARSVRPACGVYKTRQSQDRAGRSGQRLRPPPPALPVRIGRYCPRRRQKKGLLFERASHCDMYRHIWWCMAAGTSATSE